MDRNNNEKFLFYRSIPKPSIDLVDYIKYKYKDELNVSSIYDSDAENRLPKSDHQPPSSTFLGSKGENSSDSYLNNAFYDESLKKNQQKSKINCRRHCKNRKPTPFRESVSPIPKEREWRHVNLHNSTEILNEQLDEKPIFKLVNKSYVCTPEYTVSVNINGFHFRGVANTFRTAQAKAAKAALDAMQDD